MLLSFYMQSMATLYFYSTKYKWEILHVVLHYICPFNKTFLCDSDVFLFEN